MPGRFIRGRHHASRDYARRYCAVAINPKDERYFELHGKTAQLPLTDREIPIILDDMADFEFGGFRRRQDHPRARS